MINEKMNIYKYDKFNMFFWYTVVFYSILLQGAYFAKGLFTLVIMLLFYLLINKRKLIIDVNFIGFMIIFIVALMWGTVFAVDNYTSIIELSKYMLFPISYLIYINSSNIDKIESTFFRGMLFIMAFGILGYIGVNVFPEMITEKGHRLQSFLQYANTTALFMGIGILLSVDRYIRFKNKKYIFTGCLFVIALILTRSRITVFVFIVIFTIYLFFELKGRQRLIYGIILIAFIIALMIIGGRIVRISLTEPTFIERIITYQDGVKLLIRNIGGLGLGNWQFIQFSQQSAPYQVRYIHNVYLQIGLDCGVISIFIFIGMAAYQLYKNYKCKNIYYYIAVFILIHSFFEVDFNFGLLIIFYTLVFVLMNQKGEKKVFKCSDKALYKWIKIPIIILLILIFGVFRCSEDLLLTGDKLAKKSPYKAELTYNKVALFNPINNTVLFKMAQIENNPNNAIEYLHKSLLKNPYQFQVLISISEGYRYQKNYDKALYYAEELFRIFPYSKKHQSLLRTIIEESYQSGAIDELTYNDMLTKYNKEIDLKNSSINPLYKYIDNQMGY